MRFSAGYKREAVDMIDVPGLTISQIPVLAGHRGKGVVPMAARVTPAPQSGRCGRGRSRDEKLGQTSPGIGPEDQRVRFFA
ncbi:MAG: hypothetical protein OJF51_005133 [Nitrospira sp.]|jgi:hypothetical protein|nr:MAG: hypothetical protein OJF51_005133 [Nitrospira sp.]